MNFTLSKSIIDISDVIKMWWDSSPILSLGATYNIIYGERGNGKTFGVLSLIVDAYIDENLPSAYIRRLEEMIKQGQLETLFNSDEMLDYIRLKSNGKWNYVKYQFHGFYFQLRDENNNVIDRDKKPFCRAYAISTNETTKGADRGRIKYVFFDEFITRQFYLPNEVVLFQNLLETIIRKRPGVTIFMVANTVNKYCPYFKHMGLRNVKDQKQGTIDLYTLGKYNTKVACEYTKDNDTIKSNIAGQYYCFDNPQVEMIKNGSWEFDIYRTIPLKTSKSTEELTFFIEFDNQTICGNIYMYNDYPIICFFPHSKITKNRDDYIIYGEDISSPSPLHQIELARTPTHAQEIILLLFKQHKTYFANNDVGEVVANWLKYSTKGGLKI